MTGKQSTSIHRLNGDKSLNKLQTGLYYILNFINNLFPYSQLDPALEIRDFTCDNLTRYWPNLYPQSSPSRKLSDLFWMTLPWPAIKQELKTIRVLDVGCGSGNYALRLVEWSHHNIAGYTGLDSVNHSNWQQLTQNYSNFQFHQAQAGDILSYLPPNINFFISQSAIEHFDRDLLYFEQIRDYIQAGQANTIQVHLFPSQACLWLYGAHGFRQYTPRAISKISRLFQPFSYAILFRLGGAAANRLHNNFITKPLRRRREDQRNAQPQEYERLLLAAIQQDMKQRQLSPNFYALVIHSNWRQRLF
jgi:SAM-dependent methyltransferase